MSGLSGKSGAALEFIECRGRAFCTPSHEDCRPRVAKLAHNINHNLLLLSFTKVTTLLFFACLLGHLLFPALHSFSWKLLSAT